MTQQKPPIITLDGSTGEGGGQVVRLATSLSALTGIPVHITNVRANREKKSKSGTVKGGGLKAQHTTGVKALAQACGGTTENVVVGASEFKLFPGGSETSLAFRQTENDITIPAASAASATLVFQALFPYLLFSKVREPKPVRLTIKGGTNVSFSPSFEYLDQVMLPTVEAWFGVPKVRREVKKRGWNTGSAEVGVVEFEFTPVAAGRTLKFEKPGERGGVTKVDVTMLVPVEMRGEMELAVRRRLGGVVAGKEVEVVVDEGTGHAARVYVMLVAHTAGGVRLGVDCLYAKKTKGVSAKVIAEGVAGEVVGKLVKELERGGDVDEHLQDQLVVFQALAEGRSVVRGKHAGRQDESSELKKERFEGSGPFGTGSNHTMTARWVADVFLKGKGVSWSTDGEECEGVGWGKEESC
ncbi:EPT/RTPC-like protein [Ascobolus immersus RN42]|uniref:EPT/RTPC-like protein n=1 Tax=Ascobolus immersus RN42 TaxID=1160509 RepID=A0A3N4IQ41_ASCIM|nr:EPT/RTPC-like protein [Ascobolus immersus RN42]